MKVEPEILKLAPESVLKPWGLIHRDAQALTGVRVGIGEFWLASAQEGEGNWSNTITHPALGTTLAGLLRGARDTGEAELEKLVGAHARRSMLDHPHRGKTEAWQVRVAEGRTGMVSGPRTAERKDRLQRWIQEGTLGPQVEQWPPHVRETLGVIDSLSPGDVFLVPCGTLHTMFAIGRDSRLVIDELQQGYGESLLPTLSKILMVQDSVLSVQVHPCDDFVAAAASGSVDVGQDLQLNPTVRVYDFGRGRNEQPDLGFRLTDVSAGLRKVPTVRVEPAGGVTTEFLVANPHFLRTRIGLRQGTEWAPEPRCGGFLVLHCTEGRIGLRARASSMSLTPGETAFVPAALEDDLSLAGEKDSVVLADAYPDLDVVREYLTSRGTAEAEVDALFDPPRAAGD